MKPIPTVAIVIPNYNGYQDLKRCLNSIRKIRYPKFQTIVFDNASTTHDAVNIKKTFPYVKLLSFKKNYGFAEGYNRVLQKVKSKYVFLINNDTVVTPKSITTLVAFAEKYPRVAIVQPKILSLSQTDAFEYAGGCGGFVDKLGYPYCRGRLVFTVEKDRGQYDTVTDIFWASGTAMFCRLNILKKLGYFDPDLFVYVEEHDLCWRVLKLGYRVVSLPQAVIFHKGSAYFDNHMEKKIYLIHRNNLLVQIKNSSIRRLLSVLPTRVLLDYIAAFLYIRRGYASCVPSVIKAHIDVVRLFTRFWQKRKPDINKRNWFIEKKFMRPRSILFDYFIRGEKRYSDLF